MSPTTLSIAFTRLAIFRRALEEIAYHPRSTQEQGEGPRMTGSLQLQYSMGVQDGHRCAAAIAQAALAKADAENGVAVKEPCGQDNCGEASSHKMYWPGREPIAVCPGHKARAESIADAMGFRLTFEPVETAKVSP